MTDTAINAVNLNNFSFSWPSADVQLFRNVSLAFPKGDTVCLIGPNGSGKTTLMELILGWRKSDSGTVALEGIPISLIPSRERGRIMALVPQDERPAFSYSVLEYVLLGRAPYLPPLSPPAQQDRDLAFHVLEQVGITDLAHRPVPKLSGGETRMVLIARALVQQPRIMLLDEPANHLDPANRERVMEILSKLKSSGITLIISSHEPDIVTRLADFVVLLHQGRNPLMGKSDDMLVPDKLTELYGVKVSIVEAENRRIILWGN
ncbi:MAG: ABC transporter ATP-binding protein [Spirochaetes bacterium]|nr:MAG: ABC transporter ATP-binding protein [Spirochaetota bacterium]RKX88607.1 MAG: ABC transporter ATP-binding protein [Spirochaetota bacterium]RKX98487.1 MAG: ABC transporter ATP-binding protein [Spirochaetota bacterium]